MRRIGIPVLVCSLLLLLSRAAAAQESPDTTAEAREAFLHGTKLVEDARWAEALERFARAAALRPHPITSYNVAVCHRALGAYTEARRSYAESLRLSDAAADGDRLATTVRSEVEALLGQLESVVARLDVTVDPAPVKVSVDGRPVVFDGASTALLAPRGTRDAAAVTTRHFVIELDPGVRTITVQRDEFGEAVQTLALRPGARTEVAFHLDRQPSTLRIASSPSESVVRVDDVDVGTSPMTLTRPPGPHRVVILRPGFVTYETHVSTQPGEDLRISGTLVVEKVPLTRRWWFWASIGAAVVTAGVVSYAIVRSTETPEQAPFDGGSLGWTVPARFSFAH